jgi:ATP-binding cassette subfamily B protein
MILQQAVFTVLPVCAELGTILLVLRGFAQPIFIGLFCGALACYAIAFSRAAVRVSTAAKEASAAHVAANATMIDSLLNYEVVKYFAAEALVQRKVSQALTCTEVAWVRFFQRYARNGLGVAAIFAVFLAATLLTATREVLARRMTIGDFVLVNSYMLQVVRPVEMIGYAMQGLSQGAAMLERMLALFRETPESQPSAECMPLRGSGVLEFERISLSYRPNHPVLKDVSFKVPAGKTLAVVGASGSGKSTLVRLLVRLYEPDDGRILFDGVPISTLSLQTLRQSIAVVPQDTALFDETIAYNIAFGRDGATHEEIVEAAKLAHLHEFIMSLPDRYDTRVGERGVKLSGGEKQRISIARAAIKRPAVYVFDEATSSLDSNTEREILRNIQELSRSSTTLVIAHRLSTVSHADQIILLDDGVIAERGNHASLLLCPGQYAQLWEAQQHVSTATGNAGA